MIRVINMHGGNRHAPGFRVDRRSVLGNPYKIGKDGSRADVIAKYEIWLRNAIARKEPEICRALNRLWRYWRTHHELVLKCWCAPDACHADVIKLILEETLK